MLRTVFAADPTSFNATSIKQPNPPGTIYYTLCKVRIIKVHWHSCNSMSSCVCQWSIDSTKLQYQAYSFFVEPFCFTCNSCLHICVCPSYDKDPKLKKSSQSSAAAFCSCTLQPHFRIITLPSGYLY